MLNPEKREALLQLSAPLVADAMDRLGLPERILDPGVRPSVPFARMVGTAVTVRLVAQPDPTRASLEVYTRAVEEETRWCCPIIVVEVPQAHHHQGIFGEGMATLCRRNGFVGALVEGAVRDTPDLQRMGFPAFSRTVGPGFICGKVEAVSSGEPVRIGGVTVATGDIVFGDNDGVVIVDPTHLDAVLARATAIRHWESRMHDLMAAGIAAEQAEAQAGPMP